MLFCDTKHRIFKRFQRSWLAWAYISANQKENDFKCYVLNVTSRTFPEKQEKKPVWKPFGVVSGVSANPAEVSESPLVLRKSVSFLSFHNILAGNGEYAELRKCKAASVIEF